MFIFRKHSQGHFVLGLTTSFLYMVFPAAGSGVLTAQHPLLMPCCKDAAVRSQGMGDISFVALGRVSPEGFLHEEGPAGLVTHPGCLLPASLQASHFAIHFS